MKQNKKAGVTISLHALMGIIISALLIFFGLGLMMKIFYTPNYEKEVLNFWKEDIEELKSGYFTQLLDVETKKFNSNRYLLVMIPKNYNAVTLKAESRGNFDFRIKNKCNNKICLCIADIEKQRSRYCKSLSFKNMRFYSEGVNNEIRKQNPTPDDGIINEPVIFNKNYDIQKKYDYTKTPFVMNRNNNEIVVCDTRRLCEENA
ncbi:MAG: hypothetical protein ACQER9_00080 [Nanobdellota archaeon]